jgi:hypothetical protein
MAPRRAHSLLSQWRRMINASFEPRGNRKKRAGREMARSIKNPRLAERTLPRRLVNLVPDSPLGEIEQSGEDDQEHHHP